MMATPNERIRARATSGRAPMSGGRAGRRFEVIRVVGEVAEVERLDGPDGGRRYLAEAPVDARAGETFDTTESDRYLIRYAIPT